MLQMNVEQARQNAQQKHREEFLRMVQDFSPVVDATLKQVQSREEGYQELTAQDIRILQLRFFAFQQDSRVRAVMQHNAIMNK
ncbi:MAG: hypothetical protein IJ660_05240 [Alphaproteobacteria bacterium]|nr:hypothetical protein [Alphaproteobacteria bacterium]